MQTFLFDTIFSKTIHFHSFSKNELSKKILQKTRSKFLVLIFEHIFPFFSIYQLKIFSSFRSKSNYQIKPRMA